MSSGWFRQLRQEWRIPEVLTGRCVHTHCEVAQCTRCVDACPQDAWQLDDESLKIDTGRCDGCGLCVAVCPEQALFQVLEPAKAQVEGHKTLLFACQPSGPVTGKGVVPCLHALGLPLLLDHYRNGCQQILSLCGDCLACPRYRGRDFFRQRLADLNRLLASRGAPVMRHARLSLSQWQTYRDHRPDPVRIAAASPPDQAGRRGFFRQAARLAVEQALESAATLAPGDAMDCAPAWAALLPVGPVPEQVLYPYVPLIDPARCNGCDACVQLCRHQALERVDTADGVPVAYRVQAQNCSGCGVCVDACDQQALQVRMLQPSPPELPLQAGRCRACGSHFHVPLPPPPADGAGVDAGVSAPVYCRICARTDHHRQLFQVY
ncbi:MAG: 4Fe-4S binding protein [Thiothrix sp.]|nr:4Fe-4S binding protein [Thiothrix sp.]HPQ94743.1 4Fe-4S binding protein [Thiolinea sp.]